MNNSVLEKLDKIALYAVIYTAVFVLLYLTMPYILPFIVGGIIALLAQPAINFITKKFKIKRGFVGIIVVLIIFAVLSAILAGIITKIINELIALSSVLPKIFSDLIEKSYGFLDMANLYYEKLDPTIVENIKGSANKIFSGSFTIAMAVVNFLLSVLKSLPGILMFILFTLLTSIYVAIDLPAIKNKVFSLFSKENSFKAKNILFEANKMIGNYLKAYLILISITFIETYIGTSILRLKYAGLISIITSISDLLPVLGPGTILIPTGLIFILGKNYVQGIGMLVIYIVVLIVRQILEPKIVSSSLGIYPLAIIIAIYIGLKAFGFIGMIFTVFFVVFYVVLQKVGLL